MKFLLILAVVCMNIPLPAHADSWVVDPVFGRGDFQTIQDAINSAKSGDLIEVRAAHYYEHLDYLGKDLHIRSILGPTATFIDGRHRNKGSCVRFVGGESQGAILEGFTIEYGTGETLDPLFSSSARFGGGVLVLGGEPTLRGNIFRNNSVSGAGGAIYSDPLNLESEEGIRLEHNTFVGNTAESNGGAVCLLVRGIFKKNTILGNSSGYDGGGLWANSNAGRFHNSGHFEISENTFERNEAGNHGGGVAVRGKATIEFNTIWDNLAIASSNLGGSGGGAWVGIDGSLSNNTIVLNSGPGIRSLPGDNLLLLGSSATISRNIIAHPKSNRGLACFYDVYNFSLEGFSGNLIWEGDQSQSVGNGCNRSDLSDDNLVQDPMFCDPEFGDFRVAYNSPALVSSSGPLGSNTEPGCPEISTTSWGSIKQMHGSEN